MIPYKFNNNNETLTSIDLATPKYTTYITSSPSHPTINGILRHPKEHKRFSQLILAIAS